MTDKVTRTYSSPQMGGRRDRVVQIARRILAEGGSDALTINRLSEEAEVAPSAIYRSFENRGGVILATIVDQMTDIRDYLIRSPIRGNIDSVFNEYDWIAADLFRDPGFAQVAINIYFSMDADPAARQSLRSIAQMRITGWIAHTEERGVLLPRLNRERLIESQVDTEYMVLHKWARQLFPKDQVASEPKANFLMTVVAAVTNDEREDWSCGWLACTLCFPTELWIPAQAARAPARRDRGAFPQARKEPLIDTLRLDPERERAGISARLVKPGSIDRRSRSMRATSWISRRVFPPRWQ